jgi:mono/diheme cytochrome c family protein
MQPSQNALNRKRAELKDYARRHQGDSERGKALFLGNRLGCVYCHGPLGHGGDVGPDLNCIGARRNRETLMKKILEPRKGSVMPANFPELMSGPEFVDLLTYLESTCVRKATH